MGEIVRELKGNFSDTLMIWELRGSYPEIDYFPDIDIAELTAGDPDPMFLTTPIGEVNATSGNKRFYGEAWLQELERQVSSRRPIGIMGHLAEEELGTKFPDEAVHWVGVRRVNETLWGKGYLPPGAARDRVRRYKATNKTLATSIFAAAEGVWNAARGAYDMVAETLNLFQIDIGPADRVGIPGLAIVPVLTAEMAQAQKKATPGQREDKTVDKQQLIRELGGVRPQPQRGWQPSHSDELAELAAIRETLGVSEDANLAKIVSEMKNARVEQERVAVKARITEMAAADAETGIKVDSVRGLVTELVIARNPQTVEEAEAAYGQILEMQSVKDALAAAVQSKMGPPQRVPVAGQQDKARYFNIPQEA